MPDKSPLTPRQQADLRQNGLLAATGDPFYSPFGFYLEARPTVADRRRRSDGLTDSEARRLGLDKRGR